MPEARRSRTTEPADPELARAIRLVLRLGVALAILVVIGIAGVVVWVQRGQRGQQLIDAVERNETAQVVSLLNSGIDVNASTEEGVTPLMLAAYHGYKPIAEILLKHGAKIDTRDGRDETALRMAGSSHPDVVRLLLEHGADPNVRDFYGKTLLVAVCEAGADHDPETIRLLLDHGADPNISGDNGPPLIYAINIGEHGRADLVQLLLQHGANPDSKDKSESPAIAVAVDKHSPEIVAQLIAAKASVNVTDNLGRSPLRLAEEAQLPQIADILRKAGAQE